MNDIVKIKVTISTQKAGSECVDVIEFDRAIWDGMTDEQKDEECRDCAFQMMEWHWEEK